MMPASETWCRCSCASTATLWNIKTQACPAYMYVAEFPDLIASSRNLGVDSTIIVVNGETGEIQYAAEMKAS